MMLKRVFIAVGFAFLLSITVRADVVTDWNAIASQTIAASTHGGPSQMLDFATVHAAMHDAVQAYQHRFKPYAAALSAKSGSPVAAAASAARDVLVARFPSQAATINTTYDAYLAARGLATDDPGVATGHAAAAAVIAFRADDGSFPTAPVPFTGATEIGVWRPTPTAYAAHMTPWLATVRPFVAKSPSQFRPKAPHDLTSSEYAADFNEVKALGAYSGGTRTPEQTDIALFWSDNTPVQWNRALRSIAPAYVDDIGDSARLFALATMSAADALITCWDSKLTYVFWRPITAIHEAENDGNPLTEADPSWRPLLNTPNYTEYTSGANSVNAAMAGTLALFFGRDELTFSVTSNVTALPLDKRTRTFNRISDVVAEVVEARIWLGFHFRSSDMAARDAATRIARWTFTHALKPLDVDDAADAECLTPID